MFAGAVERFECAGGVALTSAIRKHGMTGSVEVGVRGLAGDACHDPAHGGPNRALHVFAAEHYDAFESSGSGRLVPPGVGENLLVRGHPDADAHVGDVLRAGTALVQVTMPTERCRNPGLVAGVPTLLRWMIETLRTGYYLRDAGDRALFAEIASLSHLAPEWKQRLLVHHERRTHSTGTENRST
ncbi:MAG: MOSC domain-containing protein [Proteobacteria bacterium]|nr:MOSC domain-containing protein [Pseudomonadota bacterium]